MGGLDDHVSAVLYIMLAMVLIIAVMATVVALMNLSKRATNSKNAELGRDIVEVDDEFFTEWDGNTINGVRLKQMLKQGGDRDCAYLIATLSLLGNQPGWGTGTVTGTSEGGVQCSNGTQIETILKGDTLAKAKIQQLPVVQIDIKDGFTDGHRYGDGDDISSAAMPINTAQGHTLYNACLVNYGCILGNAVTTAGLSGTNYTSTFKAADDGRTGTLSIRDYDSDQGLFGQTIGYKSGKFVTKQEFATSQAGEILRYDNFTDVLESGHTMYIPDGAKFNSYCLTDIQGNYMGLVFIEIAN